MVDDTKTERTAVATGDASANSVATSNEQSAHQSLLDDVRDFGAAAWRTGIINPINGVSELASDAILHPLFGVQLPTINETVPVKENMAEKFGDAVGMTLPFLASRFGVQRFSKMANFSSETALANFGRQAVTGAIMGSVFTPVTPGSNHWLDRLQNASVYAGTFGVMGSANSALLNRFGPTEDMPLMQRILRGSASGAVSGLPGGFVNAELSSLVHGRGFADSTDITNQIETFGAFGAFGGGLDAAMMRVGESGNEHESGDKSTTAVGDKFPAFTDGQLTRGRAQVQSELEQVKASPRDGQQMSVLDKLNSAPFTEAQRTRLLNSLAAVREHFVSSRDESGRLDPDQEKNWIHTQGEFGHVIESARAMKLTPQQTEDALLGSMFSDAVKNKSNFMVHHLDGAKAAAEVLPRFTDGDFTSDRIHGILQAVKEHQIGPPGFMSNIYTGNIRASINMERAGQLKELEGIKPEDRTPEQASQFATLRRAQMESQQEGQLVSYVTKEEQAALGTLKGKIADPLNQPLADTADGGKALALTDAERTLLARTGNQEWYVPSAGTPWYGSSRALINGDSIDNYSTAGGYSKLFGLNGPETDIFFRYPTVDDAFQSPVASFNQAYQIMTDEGRALANDNLGATKTSIDAVKGRTDAWLRQTLNVPEGEEMPTVPYWNSPLKYPDRGESESEWWRQRKLPEDQRTPFYEQQRYQGLTPDEVSQFQFAIKLREQMVDELRKEQRVGGDLPPDFQPVMRGD